jgi:hypothetical protein
MAKKRKKKETPVDYSVPAFQGRSIDRETAKKKARAKLQSQGIAGSDITAAMSRGKLFLSDDGTYTFKTDAFSKSRDIPLPPSD